MKEKGDAPVVRTTSAPRALSVLVLVANMCLAAPGTSLTVEPRALSCCAGSLAPSRAFSLRVERTLRGGGGSDPDLYRSTSEDGASVGELRSAGMGHRTKQGLADEDGALSFLRDTANQGSLEAKALLKILETRDDVRADCEWESSKAQVAELFLRAAQRGHADAVLLLGQCYYEGWGVPCNQTRLNFFGRLQQTGSFKAWCDLGGCHFRHMNSDAFPALAIV